jgi:hypothetical protein
MYPAGARALREDDDALNAEREAVLSAWEQKALIDEPPLRQRRLERSEQADAAPREVTADVVPLPERRTVTISGRRSPRQRQRPSAVHALVAQPDRIALWAFLLALFMVVVAAATANAAPL